MKLVDELRNGPSYVLNSDEKLLREKAAQEIERLQMDNWNLERQLQTLNAMIKREVK